MYDKRVVFGDIMIAYTQRHPTRRRHIIQKNYTYTAAHKMRSYISRLNKRLYIVYAHNASSQNR